MPEAIPALCGGTTPMAVDASGGFTSPEARTLLEFYQQGRRGFVRPRRGALEPDDA